MKKSGTKVLSADYGGEVTGKRPSPLPLITDGGIMMVQDRRMC